MVNAGPVGALYLPYTRPGGHGYRNCYIILSWQRLTVSALSGNGSMQHFWRHQSRLLVSRSSTSVFHLMVSPAVFWTAW